MHKLISALAVLVLMQAHATSLRAEFIGNAFGGQAEESTRAAASHVFQGYETFYAAMSQLERRSAGSAKEGFQKALALFKQGQAEYQSAAKFLEKKSFDGSRLEPNQLTFVMQFLAPFGGKPESDQAAILQAYATSFSQTATLIEDGSRDMTLNKFREIQTYINRQIIVGTLVSRAMGR